MTLTFLFASSLEFITLCSLEVVTFRTLNYILEHLFFIPSDSAKRYLLIPLGTSLLLVPVIVFVGLLTLSTVDLL